MYTSKKREKFSLAPGLFRNGEKCIMMGFLKEVKP